MWIITLVAVANLAIGFALAVSQGRRARGAALAMSAAVEAASGTASHAAVGPRPRPVKRPEPAPPVDRSASSGVVQEPPKPIATPAPSSPPPPDPMATHRTGSEQVSRLDRQAGEYQQQLAAIDDQLRRAAEQLAPDEVSLCVEQLGVAHREFLQCEGGIERIALPIGASAELEGAHQRLAALWQQHCQEVGEAERSLNGFSPAENLPEQCQELLEQNRKLLAIGHELRDTLGETLAGMAQAEPASRAPGAQEGEEARATLNRSQLEAFLAEWWLSHPDGAGPLSAAAVDVDSLAAVNQQSGPLAGDHVLQAVAQVLAAECGKQCPICHFSGDTFIVLMPGVGLRDATTLIERSRQQVEHTRFVRQDHHLQVTVSCGVTETSPGDDTQVLLERVAATLNEAKRYGHNRTFANEGKFPTPVMPPSFEISEKSVEL